MRKLLISLLAIFIISASTGVSAEASGIPSETEPPVLPKEPQEGILYRLPECDPLKASSDQPCYVEFYCDAEEEALSLLSQPTTITSSWTTTCGVSIKNNVGTTVARLWQDINVTWEQMGSWYHPRINWKRRGTWTKDWRYNWISLNGPYYSGGTTQSVRYNTDGTLDYLGLWTTGWSVRSEFWSTQNPPHWSCKWYRLW
jgi:hypothetical protein